MFEFDMNITYRSGCHKAIMNDPVLKIGTKTLKDVPKLMANVLKRELFKTLINIQKICSFN